jgi:hypothetical protein
MLRDLVRKRITVWTHGVIGQMAALPGLDRRAGAEAKGERHK